MKTLTYSKPERLKSRKKIEHLFRNGKSFLVFPVKALYEFSELPVGIPVQASVTVSSRNFKKAVDRNRVKRILKEAYRLNQMPLKQTLQDSQKQLAIFFIYVGKELPDFNDVNVKMREAIKRLSEIVLKP